MITGSTGNLNVWEVNDPGTHPLFLLQMRIDSGITGFTQSTYDYSGMLRFVVYKVGNGVDGPHQEQSASLADAAVAKQ